MAIYTKKGDQGETSVIIGGKQTKVISKSSQQIKAIGAVDELNSFLGVISAAAEDIKLKSEIKTIQENLLTIGSILGGSGLRFFISKTKDLEKKINELEKVLPALNNFIIPGGSKIAANLHYARTLTRRAETEVVLLNELSRVKPQILIFLNRLSDYFFILAREVNRKKGVKETVWVRGKN